MSPRKHDVPDELLSRLLANDQKPEDLIGENGLLKQLTKLLVEKALDAEMTEHLGHEKHDSVANAAGNTRNGRSRKTLKGEFGELPIEIPRDRDSTFEPKLVPKHQTRWTGLDDKILSLYARGLTVREIQAHLEEMYGAEVSPSRKRPSTTSFSSHVCPSLRSCGNLCASKQFGGRGKRRGGRTLTTRWLSSSKRHVRHLPWIR